MWLTTLAHATERLHPCSCYVVEVGAGSVCANNSEVSHRNLNYVGRGSGTATTSTTHVPRTDVDKQTGKTNGTFSTPVRTGSVASSPISVTHVCQSPLTVAMEFLEVVCAWACPFTSVCLRDPGDRVAPLYLVLPWERSGTEPDAAVCAQTAAHFLETTVAVVLLRCARASSMRWTLAL